MWQKNSCHGEQNLGHHVGGTWNHLQQLRSPREPAAARGRGWRAAGFEGLEWAGQTAVVQDLGQLSGEQTGFPQR